MSNTHDWNTPAQDWSRAPVTCTCLQCAMRGPGLSWGCYGACGTEVDYAANNAMACAVLRPGMA
eukprot:2149079-Rhodomonas_salina.1